MTKCKLAILLLIATLGVLLDSFPVLAGGPEDLVVMMTGPFKSVEQAAASRLDKPYRQRVYHVAQADENRFESAGYIVSWDRGFDAADQQVWGADMSDMSSWKRDRRPKAQESHSSRIWNRNDQ